MVYLLSDIIEINHSTLKYSELVFTNKPWYNSFMKTITRASYPSDLSDTQWETIKPHFAGMRTKNPCSVS